MPLDLAAAAIAAIAPFITKGLDKLSESMGSDLWKLIKSPFESEDEIEILEKFKAQPSSERVQGQMEYVLHKKMKEEPAFKNQLEAEYEKFNTNSQNIQNLTQTHHGSGDNVGGNKTTYNNGSR